MAVLYPNNITLLPLKRPNPPNWKATVASAVHRVRNTIQAQFRKTVPKEETDSDDSDQSDPILHQEQKSPMSNDERTCLLVLQYLPRCLPMMTYGFNVDSEKDGNQSLQ